MLRILQRCTIFLELYDVGIIVLFLFQSFVDKVQLYFTRKLTFYGKETNTPIQKRTRFYRKQRRVRFLSLNFSSTPLLMRSIDIIQNKHETESASVPLFLFLSTSPVSTIVERILALHLSCRQYSSHSMILKIHHPTISLPLLPVDDLDLF